MANIRVSPTGEKVPKRTRSADLVDQGRKAAARKAATTVQKVARAKRAVEIDLERYHGVYPYAGGRLTAEEVLRRAGLNRALLQKPRHADLKSDLKAWLLDVKKKQLMGKKIVRKAVTERVENAKGEINQIRQRWVEAELEFVEQANEIARLNRKCAELEKEIRVLRSAV